MNLNGFDARTVEPTSDFEPLPAGKYVAVITETEMKATKSGNGAYLELAFQIIEGEFKGRKLWARLNLENPNPLAVKFARSELAAICKAVNVMQPRDSVEIHNLPLCITVRQKVGEDGEIRNEIRGYTKKESPNSGASPQAASATPPWRR